MNWSTKIYHEIVFAGTRLLSFERRAMAEVVSQWGRYAELLPPTLGRAPHIKDLRRAARAMIAREWGQIVEGYAGEVSAVARKHMQEAAVFFGQEVEKAIVTTNPEAFELIPFHHLPQDTLMAAADVKFLETSLQDWKETMTTRTLQGLSEEYVRGVSAGLGMQDIARRLVWRFGFSRTSAIRLARTGIMASANRARDEVFHRNRDILRAVKYVATLDPRTCEICAGYDGNVYEEMGSKPFTPVHVQCRCTYVPVMKSAKDLGLGDVALPPAARESMDGAVPETTTFGGWFRQQDQARQAEILRQQYGVRKAEAFLTGTWKPPYLMEGRENLKGFRDRSKELTKILVESEILSRKAVGSFFAEQKRERGQIREATGCL